MHTWQHDGGFQIEGDEIESLELASFRSLCLCPAAARSVESAQVPKAGGSFRNLVCDPALGAKHPQTHSDDRDVFQTRKRIGRSKARALCIAILTICNTLTFRYGQAERQSCLREGHIEDWNWQEAQGRHCARKRDR